ncbi:MAG: hypothetical protein IKB47_01960 [Clostridia bacterium]|nr:hypothetical protein [Clostridia bacterium]
MERIFDRDAKNSTKALRPVPFAIMMTALILAAAYPGSGLNSEGFALFVVALTAFTVIVFSRSVFCILLTAIPVSLAWLYTGGSFIYPALICSPVIVIGLGAFLLRTTRSPLLLGVVPVSYLVALILDGRPIAALWSLVFFPAAYVLASGFSGKVGRVALICRTSIALAATGAVAGIVYLTVANGYFSFELVKNTSDGLLKAITSYFTDQYAALAAQYAALGIDVSSLAISAADAELYSLSLFALVPSAVVFILNGFSFVAYQLNVSLFARTGQKSYLTPTTISFVMSRTSALLFVAAYLVTFFCSFSDATTFSIVTENLYMILMPGLVLTGILVAFGKGGDGRRHTMRIVFIAILIFFSPGLALALTAFMGCSSVLSARRHIN